MDLYFNLTSAHVPLKICCSLVMHHAWLMAVALRTEGRRDHECKQSCFFKYLINQLCKCLMRNKMYSVSLLGLNDSHNEFVISLLSVNNTVVTMKKKLHREPLK